MKIEQRARWLVGMVVGTMNLEGYYLDRQAVEKMVRDTIRDLKKMNRPLPPLAVPTYNPPLRIDKKHFRVWTAAELITESSAVPESLRARFNSFLGAATPSKRKAREFLASLPTSETHVP